MKLTAQQQAIASHRLDGTLKVIAYAGTGKTSSLVALSHKQAERGKRGLYLAFNKSSENDARSRFPSTVVCRTVHSLAFRAIGYQYQKKLRELKVIDVIRQMDLDWDWVFARWVLNTITAWSVSDLVDFPKTAIDLNGPVVGPAIRVQYAAVVAAQLWTKMIDPSTDTPMTHDGYLKLYQLSFPKISADYLMLDEGQDTNPVTWDIVRRQTCPVVIVGDRYQSIYQFRGAMNAMDQAQSLVVLPLTQSFRFGPNLAVIANTLLQEYFQEPMRLEGCGPVTHIGEFPLSLPYAVIARTNGTVFDEAVRGMREGKSLGFAGGVHSYGFDSFIDCWHLCNQEKHLVRDVFLKGFGDFEELCEYVDNSGDVEVKRMVEVIQNYGSSVLDIVPAIHGSCLPHLASADLILSTAHRCKGLTLERVRLANDFPELIGSDGNILPASHLNRQEVNLIYVAATRASKALALNQATIEFLSNSFVDVRDLMAPNALIGESKQLSAPAPSENTALAKNPNGLMAMASLAQSAKRRRAPSAETQAGLFEGF